MSDTDRNRARAAEYIVPRTHSFWRWGDGRATLEWSDGKTIAFRGEIEAVLAALAPGGLPPFGSIVLLLAATRDGFLEPPSRSGLLLSYASHFSLPSLGKISGVLPHRLNAEVKRVGLGLAAIARLPAELRQPIPAKAVLAQTIFETAERPVDATEAGAVLELLGSSMITGILVTPAEDNGLRQFVAELDALHVGLLAINEDQLKLRARTGLDQLPKPVEIKLPDELPPARRVQQLVRRLQSDPELSGVARLTQKLMAAIHVPRSLAAAEELPVGGVSDLSNRGSFDRLLVSELAHDDLMLAVRVAMNEALYLRRESPPRRPPPRRAILIDCGIRLWGVPRLFATAVGLALAATADARGELAVYHPAADRAVPVDFSSREGLVAQLAALQPDPHPGRALKSFDALTSAGTTEIEMIVVTHADVLADPDFTAQASAAAHGDWYAAVVDRDGAFSLYLCGAGGRRRVCEARIALDDLLAAPPTGPQPVPLLPKDFDPSLPVILAVDPFPLRLPYVLEAKSARTSVRYGLFGITDDGRLLQWDSEARGAKQLTATLPRGKFYDLFIDDTAGFMHAVFHYKKFNRLHVLSFNLRTGESTRFDVGANVPQAVCYREGVLFLIFRRQVQAVSLSTGVASMPLRLPDGMHSRSNRFLSDLKDFFALAFDGSRVVMNRVASAGKQIFDRDGIDGPWLLDSQGDLSTADGSQSIRPAKPFDGNVWYLDSSPDGHRHLMRSKTDTFKLDLKAHPDRWIRIAGFGEPEMVGEQLAWCSKSSIAPFKGLDALYVDEAGELRLFTKSSRTVHGFMINQAGDLILADLGALRSNACFRMFSQPRKSQGRAFSWAVIKWQDGSRAFVDGRGLLHLKSSDRSVPEISLALTTEAVAGWTSEGQTFGGSYFLERPPNVTAAYGLELIRQFTARLR